MSEVEPRRREFLSTAPPTDNLADILERVLDKGIVIAGDIKVDLLDIELLTIRLRLFIASVDTAKKAGIDWWETDPALSSRAAREELREENQELRRRLRALEAAAAQERDEQEAELEAEPGLKRETAPGSGAGSERPGRRRTGSRA